MLREVRLRRGLDAVRVVAVVDGVQVLGQDRRLRLLARQLDRETRLLELAVERLLLAGVEIADELLRDRRAALDDLAGRDVLPGGAGDALVVDPAVLVEAAVLDRNRCERQPLRHLPERHRLAVPLGGDRAEQRAVARVDERVLPDLDRPQRTQVAALRQRRARAEPDRRQRSPRRRSASVPTITPALRRRRIRAARFFLRPRWREDEVEVVVRGGGRVMTRPRDARASSTRRSLATCSVEPLRRPSGGRRCVALSVLQVADDHLVAVRPQRLEQLLVGRAARAPEPSPPRAFRGCESSRSGWYPRRASRSGRRAVTRGRADPRVREADLLDDAPDALHLDVVAEP